MPFTISHVAAVLPFTRALARWRVLSAAVIGSMVPDFGWFWPWPPPRFETHSLDALGTFCLPVGLAAYWLFQRLIRTPLLELLPPAAYSRWRDNAVPADYRDLRQWIVAAYALLAGALTHLLWDEFTHEGTRGVRMLPALEDPAVEINGHRIAGVHLLQDANSVIGLVVVLAVLAYGLRPGRPGDAAVVRRLRPAERRLWIAAYVLAAVALSGAFLLWHHAPAANAFSVPISGAAIATLRGLAGALVGVSVLLTVRLEADARGHGGARGG
jgi:hypothetical protein